MKNGIIALAAASIFATGSALAFHCPADMAKIDAALAKNPQLSAAQLDEVKCARKRPQRSAVIKEELK